MPKEVSPAATFKSILVPIDFGEPAARALDVAIALASKFESTLTLLHVSLLPMPAYDPYASGLDWPIEELEKNAKLELDSVLSKVKDRCAHVEGIVVSGEPWQAILDAAKERDADLIVMGTHGRRGVSHILLGSVAEKIVRLSPIPVLTISGKGQHEAKAKARAEICSR